MQDLEGTSAYLKGLVCGLHKTHYVTLVLYRC